MIMSINILLLCFIHILVAQPTKITPKDVDAVEYVDIKLTSDPRKKNKVKDNKWQLYQDWDKPLYDWGLELTLEAKKYGFNVGKESMISISIDGYCPGDNNRECDAYWGFQFGDTSYIAFFNDFDGHLHVIKKDGPQGKRQNGIFVFPETNTNLKSGDISDNISQIKKGKLKFNSLRSAVAGGDDGNWYRVSRIFNGDIWPVRFEIINNDNNNELTLKFFSSTFESGIIMKYNYEYDEKLTNKPFKLFLTPDGGNEWIKIKSFEIKGSNVGSLPVSPPPKPIECDCDDMSSYKSAQADGINSYIEDGNNYYKSYKHDDKLFDNFDIILGGIFCNAFLTLIMILMFSYVLCRRQKSRYVSIEKYEKEPIQISE
eukprot:130141_1